MGMSDDDRSRIGHARVGATAHGRVPGTAATLGPGAAWDGGSNTNPIERGGGLALNSQSRRLLRCNDRSREKDRVRARASIYFGGCVLDALSGC
jgi:hypothetical protein